MPVRRTNEERTPKATARPRVISRRRDDRDGETQTQRARETYRVGERESDRDALVVMGGRLKIAGRGFGEGRQKVLL